MSFWEDLAKGGASGLFTGLGTLIKDIRTAITGQTPLDPARQAELMEKLAAIEAQSIVAAAEFDKAQMAGQIEIDKIEAASPQFFKSGWRPAVGWVCVSGLAYTFLLKPVLPWIVSVAALAFGTNSAVPVLPEVPMGDMIVLLAGMLGLGTMRTFEKVKGASK